MLYVTMQNTFVTRILRNVERNLHCDVLHITSDRVARLVLDCNGVFAIKAYCILCLPHNDIHIIIRRSVITTIIITQ